MLLCGNEKMAINLQALPKHLDFVQNIAMSVNPTPIQYSLSNSCGQALSLNELAALIGEDFSSLYQVALGYAPLRGSELLREKIVQFHQQLNHHQSQLTAENVLTFCGAQEALAALYQLLLKPGDEVVVVTPNYPSLTQMAEQAGCKVQAITLSADNQWCLSYRDFEQRVNENTKLIVINSPHNPSGTVIDSKLADKILALAERYNSYVVVDDVSQASNYHQLALSHCFLDYDKGVVVSVMSKSFGLAGLRIGWALSKNTGLIDSLLAIKSYGSICCSALDEAVATLALTHANKIVGKNNHLIKQNIALFEQLVKEFPDTLDWCPPQAGILALVEVKDVDDIEQWAKQLVQATGILALPGTLFGLTGSYFRLGLGQQNFSQVLALFRHYLTRHLDIKPH